MAILNNSNAISSGSYDINNSLRFRSSASAYLNRTAGSTTNRQTWTWSGWVKRGTLGARQHLFVSANPVVNTSSQQEFQICFDSSDKIEVGGGVSGVGNDLTLNTTQVFRDPSAWYHLVVAVDTTQATSTNRVKLYVNGVQVTAFSTATYPAQNYNTSVNLTGFSHRIGGSGGSYLDAYQAEINFIDGSAKTPSDFGETDTTTGSWKPKAYTSTYGTNGFYLKFSDIATTSGSNAGLGKDFSGNANYWTTNNISVTAGTTYDAMIDSPTLTSATVANYPVLNPLLGDALDLPKDGNLKVGGTANNYSVGTIAFPTTGKFYAEATVTTYSSGQVQIGICPANATSTLGSDATAYFQDGTTTKNNVASTTLASYTQGDVIGIAVDVDNSTVQFYKNNTAQTALTSVLRISTASFFTYMSIASSVVNFNFGQRPFSYTPPTGFVRLNTYNLPDSTIKKGNTVMDATLWTGNGTSQSIVNASAFKPDFVWVKSRSNTFNNNLFNSTSGINKFLVSDTTAAEASVTGTLTAFNSNGFSVGSDIGLNYSGGTYVGWQWQAGQGSTSNIAINQYGSTPSIASTVSVNATAGFSVVTYTGTGTTGTVGHGLGVAPSFIIAKNRSSGVTDWPTYHISTGNNGGCTLNETAAKATTSIWWNNTTPTSTLVTLGSGSQTNGSGNSQLLYCWSEIAGFSKFTSYTGNGSADGPFIFTGFRPKWLMIKRTDATQNWIIVDTSRDTYNVANKRLFANLSDAEDLGITNYVDLLSNGFKCRDSNISYNASGGTYIVMAYAENPFKNSNAR
jgi:hypothetical protein